MTIPSQTTKVVALGDGSTTVFSYDFLIPTTADVQITYTDANGIETVLATIQYTITGINDPVGGTVTYPLVGSPIATGTTLTIARALSYTQSKSVANQGNFYPSVVESGLDYLTMLTQQLYELFSRAIVAPISDPDALLPLPTVAQRANQLLGFDGDGNPIASEPSSALVSSAMQPVVSAATLALARTAMGLGAMATEGIGAGLFDDAGNATVRFPTNAVASAQAPVASDHLTQYIATGPIVFTLARANTYFTGYGIWINAFVDTITIAIDSHDSVKGQSSGVSFILPVGWKVFIYTDAASTGTWYIELTRTNFSYTTVGVVNDFAGATAPNGWILCYGQNVSRTTYAALFAVIGTAFGTGDGSTTFGIPDYRGRIGAGKDDMGGSAANRITNAVAGFHGETLAAAGGDQRMQSHTHGLTVRTGATGSNNAPAGSDASGSFVAATNPGVGTAGLGNSQNVQPTIIINKIIFTGVYS